MQFLYKQPRVTYIELLLVTWEAETEFKEGKVSVKTQAATMEGQEMKVDYGMYVIGWLSYEKLYMVPQVILTCYCQVSITV